MDPKRMHYFNSLAGQPLRKKSEVSGDPCAHVWMPVVSEIVRVLKSNLHCAIAYRMRAKFQLLDNCIPGPPNVYVRVTRPFRFGPRGYASLCSRRPNIISG